MLTMSLYTCLPPRCNVQHDGRASPQIPPSQPDAGQCASLTGEVTSSRACPGPPPGTSSRTPGRSAGRGLPGEPGGLRRSWPR